MSYLIHVFICSGKVKDKVRGLKEFGYNDMYRHSSEPGILLIPTSRRYKQILPDNLKFHRRRQF